MNADQVGFLDFQSSIDCIIAHTQLLQRNTKGVRSCIEQICMKAYLQKR